jgi:surface antigen
MPFVPHGVMVQQQNPPQYVLGPQVPEAGNRYCREFQKVVTIGGRSERACGVACQ